MRGDLTEQSGCLIPRDLPEQFGLALVFESESLAADVDDSQFPLLFSKLAQLSTRS
jgi:hypothetical protein